MFGEEEQEEEEKVSSFELSIHILFFPILFLILSFRLTFLFSTNHIISCVLHTFSPQTPLLSQQVPLRQF